MSRRAVDNLHKPMIHLGLRTISTQLLPDHAGHGAPESAPPVPVRQLEMFPTMARTPRPHLRSIMVDGVPTQMINEAGLRLLLKVLDTPAAREFDDWLTREVIPSVRQGRSDACRYHPTARP